MRTNKEHIHAPLPGAKRHGRGWVRAAPAEDVSTPVGPVGSRRREDNHRSVAPDSPTPRAAPLFRHPPVSRRLIRGTQAELRNGARPPGSPRSRLRARPEDDGRGTEGSARGLRLRSHGGHPALGPRLLQPALGPTAGRSPGDAPQARRPCVGAATDARRRFVPRGYSRYCRLGNSKRPETDSRPEVRSTHHRPSARP